MTAWLLMVLVRVQSAAAAPITVADKIGQTPPALAWIQLQDSRGISIWNHELSLDRGGITSPDKFYWASITDACWGAYRSWCALSLWFLDWVLSFDWVHTIASPLLSVGTAMQQIVTRLGLVTTFLTLTAVLAGRWMLKGRHTTAVWEIGIACVIASLASGVFAHPVEMIAGQNGYIVKANQTGQELAAALATGDAAGKTPEQLRKAQTGQLVDTFIREPTQLINYGRIIDETKCEGAYNDVVKAGPYGTASTIRDKVGACDKTLGEYAASPTASMALGSIVFMPASFVTLFLALVLGGSVLAAAVWAMFQALKAIVTLVTGLLPGGGRGSLMLTAAETIIALLIIVFTSVFLSVFLLVIQAMFSASGGDSAPRTFVIVDILLVVGTAVYMRQRKQIKAATHRLAQWMTQRPGGAPATRLPDRAGGAFFGTGTSRAAALGIAAVHARAKMLEARKPPAMMNDNRQQAVMFFGATRRGGDTPAEMPVDLVPNSRPSSPGRPQLPPGPDHPRLPGGPDNPQLPPGGSGGGGLKRIEARKKVTGTLVRAGTSAALAYATGGASTAVTGAAKAARAAQTARRAAVTSRMAIAAGKSAVAGPNTAPSHPAAARPVAPRTDPIAAAGRIERQSPAARGQVITGQVLSSSTSPARPGPTRPLASGASDVAADTTGASSAPRRPAGSGTVNPQNAERAERLKQRLAQRSRDARRSA